MSIKLKVALLFGGRSTEHEVSVISALQAFENLDKSKYEVIPIFVSKNGQFYTNPKFLELKNFKDVTALLLSSTKITLGQKGGKGGFFQEGFLKPFVEIDLALPLFHGSFGEDGCVQGIFETYQIPYTGFNVLGSAVAMDKIISKYVFRSLGFNVAKFISINREEWIENPDKCLKLAKDALQFPLIVKPADIGSTIGITKAGNIDKLSFGIEVASAYSDKILIEEAFKDCIEVNCAALGYRKVIPSLCEMPLRFGETLSYEDKYIRGGKGVKGGKRGGMASLSRKIPAPISKQLSREITEATVRIFKELEGCGVVRVDYFVDTKLNKFWVNEVNSPPGSMAFYLFEPIGMKYQKLLDRVIECGLERFENAKKTQYAFDSPLLSQMAKAAVGNK